MIEEVHYQNEVLAIIVRRDFHKEEFTFLHPMIYLSNLLTCPTLLVKKFNHMCIKRYNGKCNLHRKLFSFEKEKLKVDFYSVDQEYLESRILESGDVILLIKGGHGFEVLEDLEMFEVKQGPYAGDADKIKFTP